MIDLSTINHLYPKIIAQTETINQMLERASKGRVFARFDLTSWFWQIPVAESARDPFSFTVHLPDGTTKSFRHVACPMGFVNSTQYSTLYLNRILSPLRDNLAIQVDDLLLWADDEDKLKELVFTFLAILRTHRITEKEEKCLVGVTELVFAGKLISHGHCTRWRRRQRIKV